MLREKRLENLKEIDVNMHRVDHPGYPKYDVSKEGKPERYIQRGMHNVSVLHSFFGYAKFYIP